MAKKPDTHKKPGKTPKSKAHRPDVQPSGPALAELLNPAINRGDAGMGSGTGLQPPPDNSWDRRASGEAAAHRARAPPRERRGCRAARCASRKGGGSAAGIRHVRTIPRRYGTGAATGPADRRDDDEAWRGRRAEDGAWRQATADAWRMIARPPRIRGETAGKNLDAARPPRRKIRRGVRSRSNRYEPKATRRPRSDWSSESTATTAPGLLGVTAPARPTPCQGDAATQRHGDDPCAEQTLAPISMARQDFSPTTGE